MLHCLYDLLSFESRCLSYVPRRLCNRKSVSIPWGCMPFWGVCCVVGGVSVQGGLGFTVGAGFSGRFSLLGAIKFVIFLFALLSWDERFLTCFKRMARVFWSFFAIVKKFSILLLCESGRG